VWAIGRFDLGLSEEELWNLTLPEFNALLERKRERDERADLRAGTVAAVIANAFRSKGTRAYGPADFMPTLQRHERRQPWQKQLATAMVITEIAKIRAEKEGGK